MTTVNQEEYNTNGAERARNYDIQEEGETAQKEIEMSKQKLVADVDPNTNYQGGQTSIQDVNGEKKNKVSDSGVVKDGQDEKTEEMKKKEAKEKLEASRKKAVEMMRDIFESYRCQIIFSLVCNVFGMSAELASPLFIGFIIDAILSKQKDEINHLIIIWMSITVGSSILNGIQAWLMKLLAAKIGYKMRQELFVEIMRKDIEFFDENKTGQLMSRLQDDIQKIEEGMTAQIALVLKASIFCITVVFIIFGISWRMTLFMLAILLPLMFYGKCIGSVFRKLKKQESDQSAVSAEIAQESFGNIRTVKAFGTEDHQSAQYATKLEDIYQTQLTIGRYYGMHEFVMTGVMFGVMDALIFMSSYLYFENHFSIGKINSFNSYMFSFLINFVMMASVLSNVLSLQGTMAGIAQIYLYYPKILIDGGEDVTTDSISDGSIRIEDIKFTYPTKKEINVIKNASIHVEKNTTVALVGSSGCGKSTIIQLVERFYDPVGGSVKYGQQDLKTLNAQSYKSNVAIVQQEPVLFSGTIKDNIVYGLTYEPTQEDIDFVCTQANVHTFVNDKQIFPDGYDTVVGERGVKLSGGQKQRIAIARALIRKPKVLLLDEATSALDAESEHQVQQALDQILANTQLTQTVIVIAHRLSTIKDADTIIVINKGVIAEQGTHDELIAKGGAYAKLVARQLATAEVGQ